MKKFNPVKLNLIGLLVSGIGMAMSENHIAIAGNLVFLVLNFAIVWCEL